MVFLMHEPSKVVTSTMAPHMTNGAVKNGNQISKRKKRRKGHMNTRMSSFQVEGTDVRQVEASG